VVRSVILEFEAGDIRHTDDLMKLLEALLNGRKTRWKEMSIDKQNNGGS